MISRKNRGNKFIYLYEGTNIKDKSTIDRIKNLVIPPAWTHVEIAPSQYAKIQVKGRDSLNRHQYIYSRQWIQTQDKEKFKRLLEFSKKMPSIKRRLKIDFNQPNFPKTWAVAGVFKFILCLNIRAGNTIYAQKNKSYGVCTLQKEHVTINPTYIKFTFKGKSGVDHELKLKNRELMKFIKILMEFPGKNLFQYMWGGKYCKLRPQDLNGYIKKFNPLFITKDIRTYTANLYFIKYIRNMELDKVHMEKNIQNTIARIAHKLGNTKTVSRKSYILPYIVDQYRIQPQLFRGDNISSILVKLLSTYLK